MRPVPDLQLYIHLPFCIRKCPYCDFNSHVRPSIDWQMHETALLAELGYWAGQAQFADRRFATIFFGGGTPSLAPPELIKAALERAEAFFGFEKEAEISLEANPGAVDASNFSDYRSAGINRLSIGVQSFDDGELAWLGRIHTAAEAEQAFVSARDAGFDNVSLDLIYGLPGQTVDEWMRSVDRAIELHPEHLSCYQLTIEPHTQLATRHGRKPFNLPEDEHALVFFESTRRRLLEAGYAAYEISNFARSDFGCRHNDGYWRYCDYIGIGAGACGKWDETDGGAVRYTNLSSPESYMAAVAHAGSAVKSQEQLDAHMAAAESIWLGLRRETGIDRAWFEDRFGPEVWSMLGDRLERWRISNHLVLSDSRLYLTSSGIPLADSIAASVF